MVSSRHPCRVDTTTSSHPSRGSQCHSKNGPVFHRNGFHRTGPLVLRIECHDPIWPFQLVNTPLFSTKSCVGEESSRR